MNDNMPFIQSTADKCLLAHLAFVQFLLIRWCGMLGGRVLFQRGQRVVLETAMIAYETLFGFRMQLLVAFQIRSIVKALFTMLTFQDKICNMRN